MDRQKPRDEVPAQLVALAIGTAARVLLDTKVRLYSNGTGCWVNSWISMVKDTNRRKRGEGAKDKNSGIRSDV